LQALVLADKSPKQADRDIADSCVSIVMFAVPNLGLNNTSFLDMTENQENHELMRNMGPNSTYLRQLDEDFGKIVAARNIKIAVVYETQNTPSFEVCSPRDTVGSTLIRAWLTLITDPV
jgi:hypothetical protein